MSIVPTGRLIWSLVVTAAVIGFWATHGFVKEGDRRAKSSKPHTPATAFVINAAAGGFLVFALTMATRGFLRGGNLRLGRRHKTSIQLAGGEDAVVDALTLPRHRGIEVHFKCTRSTKELVTLCFALEPEASDGMQTTPRGVLRKIELAWEAEDSKNTTLVPDWRAERYRLAVRADQDHEDCVKLELRWHQTLALLAPREGA